MALIKSILIVFPHFVPAGRCDHVALIFKTTAKILKMADMCRKCPYRCHKCPKCGQFQVTESGRQFGHFHGIFPRAGRKCMAFIFAQPYLQKPKAQTSMELLTNQFWFIPSGFISEWSSWRRMYSVYQRAVSTGFMGRSLNFRDNCCMFFLYLKKSIEIRHI